jgi:two-component system, cell cycle sensor histidine kinase and response regulator CckA
VVEDEESVRRMCARVLEGEGYRVLTAGDGLQALDLLELDGADIQLVITDLQMPRLNGLQLSAHLASSRTAPPVMFISGYNLERPTDRRILAKPFKPSDLVAVVQSMLGESTPLQTELRTY